MKQRFAFPFLAGSFLFISLACYTQQAGRNTHSQITRDVRVTDSLRQQALQLDFIRLSNPKLFSLAEAQFQKALYFRDEKNGDSLKINLSLSQRNFASLINSAVSKLKTTLNNNGFKGVQTLFNPSATARKPGGNNLRVLNNYFLLLNGSALVDSRISTENFFDREPVFSDPLPQRPNSPLDLKIESRGADNIKISWTDISDNESGNRILRSTDGISWAIIALPGIIQKGIQFFYEDKPLSKSTKYYYRIEVFRVLSRSEPEVSSRSPAVAGYTRDGTNIGLFRLQLRVKVATIPNGDARRPLKIEIGHDRGDTEKPFVYTLLDYGRDDFLNGSNFTYDLNFEGVTEISDLGDIKIKSTAHGALYIEEVALLVNNRQVFQRTFGNNLPTVLRLGFYGTYVLYHSELAAHSDWSDFVTQNINSPLPVGLIMRIGTPSYIEIPLEEIKSRIESLVGHMCHDDPVSGRIGWGNKKGSDWVELVRVDSNTYRISLDLKSYHSINVEFQAFLELSFSKSCNGNQLVLTILSENFRGDADFPLWKDILTLGITKIIDKVADDRINSTCEKPEIRKNVSMLLPSCIPCGSITLNINEQYKDLNVILNSDVSACLGSGDE